MAAAMKPLAAQSRKTSRIAARERNWGLLFLGPWILGFLLFFLGPMVASLVFSFTNYQLLSDEIKFVGLDNWVRLFNDPLVQQSFVVTGRFLLISVPLTMGSALLAAVLLNSKLLKGKALFRTLFYLPVMIPGVAATLIWAGVLNTQTGWINLFLNWLGVGGPDWLNDSRWVIPALSLISLWGLGNTMVIMLAGLQGVPTELYEAAKVDGAGPVYSFFNITIPMISPVLFYNLVLSVIGGFQYFLTAFVIYNNNSGPDNAALFYMLNLFKEAFAYYNMGYASTLAWAMFLVALVVTLGLFATARRWVYYAGGEA
ncbi:MAG TPA: sugar ABC transporter permease [Roseiflexaceae bacterium]|nr:sugar ABC transporter permease [Roseiflexaceae bacterium]